MPMRVAAIDSGATAGHPHVGAIAGGVTIGVYQNSPGFADLLGHGTAVCGAIRMHCADCDLFAVRVFEKALTATGKAVLRAIDWSLDEGMQIVNLSLGTRNEALAPEFEARIARAKAQGAVIVSPWEALPGALDGVVAVRDDNALPFGSYRTILDRGRRVVAATGFARPVPGVPPQFNFEGASFAAAHVAGLLAARWQRDLSLTRDAAVAAFLSEGEAESVGGDLL